MNDLISLCCYCRGTFVVGAIDRFTINIFKFYVWLFNKRLFLTTGKLAQICPTENLYTYGFQLVLDHICKVQINGIAHYCIIQVPMEDISI